MERSTGKLVDLTLVSKYYPVANYSYPRKNSTCTITTTSPRSYSRCSSNINYCRGRESLGSEGSAPGLVEDRADSEVSLDDDYQYHAHMTELWDSFWPPRSTFKSDDCFGMQTKQYPALIPSPHRKTKSLGQGGQEPPAWPLPSSSSPEPQPQTRKPVATYSAFPRPSIPLSTSRIPPFPVRTTSRRLPTPQSPTKDNKPIRPPRPVETLLPPCIQQPTFSPVNFAMLDYTIQKDYDLSPIAPNNSRRPTTSYETRTRERSETGSSNRPSTCSDYSLVSRSVTHLPTPEIWPLPFKTPRHFKSIAAMSPCHIEQEPQSVFEDDSDDDVEEERNKKFFRFHKRSESDHKRRRNRTTTMLPITPTEEEARPHSAYQKRHGNDVFGRILGRRSR